MKKFLYLALVILLAVSAAPTSAQLITMGGQKIDKTQLIEFSGDCPATLSPSGKAYMCYDADTDTLMCSVNGGAYAACSSGGSGDMLKSTYDTDDDGVVEVAASVQGSGDPFISAGGVNWNDLYMIRGAAINWTSIENFGGGEFLYPQADGSVNWTDLETVMGDVNWSSLEDFVGDAQINWLDVQEIANDNINWVSIPSVLYATTIDGGGSAIDDTVTDPVFCSRIERSCTVQAYYLACDQSCSITLDVWKNTFDDTPETNSDSIAGTEKPTLSSDVSMSDTSLTSMTTDWNNGDNVCIEIESASTCERCWLNFVGYYD